MLVKDFLEKFELIPMYERRMTFNPVLRKELTEVESNPALEPIKSNILNKYRLEIALGLYFHADSNSLHERLLGAKARIHDMLFGEIVRNLEEILWAVEEHDNKKAIYQIKDLLKKIDPT